MIAARPGITETAIAVHGGHRALADARAVEHDFSVCLNAFGPADVVRRTVERAAIDEYPDPECRAPRAAAAAHWQRPIDEITFGAGAAEFIHAVALAYLDDGDTVLIAAPSFGEYERAARLRRANTRIVWCGLRETHDDALARLCAEVESTKPRLTVLCAPTTPAGLAISRPDVLAVADACDNAGSLLVLDQAYDAFAEHPLGTPAVPGHPAVLHLRSLTKEHALAGLRVAFAIGPAPVIDALNRVRVPWSASSAAQAAAVAALSRAGAEHVARTVAALRAEAVRLQEACTQLGFSVEPSATHYFVAHVGDASAVRALLLDRARICVRDCTSFGLPEHIRVAARTIAANDALIRALGMPELDRYRGAHRQHAAQ
jgi:histidinol-phosphate aminotransferase